MDFRAPRTLRIIGVGLIAVHLAGTAGAQDAVGKVGNWTGGTADRLFWQIGEAPEAAGQEADVGTVTLDLPTDVETPQQLSQVLRCADGSETNKDPDAPYAITTTLQYVRQATTQEITGGLVAAATQDAAAARGGDGPVAEGRSYQWIYTPRPATIDGVCTSDFFPAGKTRVEQTTRIDMVLQPGWNILEVELDEIEFLSDGLSVALGRSLRIVTALPDDAQWLYRPE